MSNVPHNLTSCKTFIFQIYVLSSQCTLMVDISHSEVSSQRTHDSTQVSVRSVHNVW